MRRLHVLAPWLFSSFLALGACGGGSDDGADAAEPGPPEEVCECDGATCGVDNCGEACGSCAGGEMCLAGTCEAAAFCTESGFVPTRQLATARVSETLTVLQYEANNREEDTGGGGVIESDEALFDRIVIETRRGEGHQGPAERGNYPVGAIAPDCDLCIYAYQDCTGGDCKKVFAAREGTVHVDSPGGGGQPFEGSLYGVVFEEVYLDPPTGQSYKLPAGDTWCLDGFEIAQPVTDIQIYGDCDEAGTGTDIGDQIRNFELQDCNGDFVGFHDRCGSSAVLAVATAGWCGACEAFIPEAKRMYDAWQGDGMDLMIVVGEDQLGNAATLDYCKAYAAGHDLPNEMVFIDHDGKSGWTTFFGAVNTYSKGSIGLPFIALFSGADMTYVWSTTQGAGSLENNLQALVEP